MFRLLLLYLLITTSCAAVTSDLVATQTVKVHVSQHEFKVPSYMLDEQTNRISIKYPNLPLPRVTLRVIAGRFNDSLCCKTIRYSFSIELISGIMENERQVSTEQNKFLLYDFQLSDRSNYSGYVRFDGLDNRGKNLFGGCRIAGAVDNIRINKEYMKELMREPQFGANSCVAYIDYPIPGIIVRAIFPLDHLVDLRTIASEAIDIVDWIQR